MKIFFLLLFIASCFNQTLIAQTSSGEGTSPSVQVGQQVWMSKNLAVKNYRNGDPIPQIQDPVAWSNATTGAWCYYNGNEDIGSVCGIIYNGWAIMDPRGLAPEGWRVTTAQDWSELLDYVAKEKGFTLTRGEYRDTQIMWNGADGSNPMFVDKEMKGFDAATVGKTITNKFRHAPNGKWISEMRTATIKDFLSVYSGSNELGLNFMCCSTRSGEKGNFYSLGNSTKYGGFQYPSDIVLKDDNFFYLYDINLNTIGTFVQNRAKVIIKDVTVDFRLDSSPMSFLLSEYPGQYKPAKYSRDKLNNEHGLGGNSEGYYVRCVKGDQWIDERTGKK